MTKVRYFTFQQNCLFPVEDVSSLTTYISYHLQNEQDMQLGVLLMGL